MLMYVLFHSPFLTLSAPPARETPLSFAHPHVPVRFGPGGQLVIGLPIISGTSSVEIHSVQVYVTHVFVHACLMFLWFPVSCT